MVEPRLKKAMKGGGEPPKKKVMYLRLGYVQTPRDKNPTTDKKRNKTKKKVIETECPGGKQNCGTCKMGAKIIPAEELLKGSPETAELVCTEPFCEENCAGCPVGLKP